MRLEAPWCTQCYAPTDDGRPEHEPSAPSPTTDDRGDSTTVGAAHVPTGESVASWPCTGCGTDNALRHDVCGTCGLPFLAAARAREPLLVLPLVGDLTALSPGRRTWLAVAVVAAFVAVCVVLGLLLS